MIRSLKYCTIFILMVLSFTTLAQDNSLKVIVKNIELVEGRLFLKLSADSVEFNSDKFQEAFVKEKDVTANEMVFIFINLKGGTYGLSVYQDLNANGKLDIRKFGIPAEPFAFSNDAIRKFGPPRFSQAKFEVRAGEGHVQVLNLIYKKPAKNKKDQ